MNILHITNDFSLTKVHSSLYRELDKSKIRQIIFNPTRNSTPIGNNLINFKNNKSEIIYSKKMKWYHSFLFRIKVKFLFDDLLRKTDLSQVDICHATTLFSDGAIAHKIKKKNGTPYIVAVRATDIDVFLKYRPDLIFTAKLILEGADKIIFISDSLRKRFLNHKLVKNYRILIESKSVVIYNGIDDFWLDNIRPKKDCIPSKILFVGRLIKRKNISKLAESVVELNKAGNNLELNIVGSGGSDETLIRNLSEQYKNTINFYGEVKEKESLKKIYQENHIFAMPSIGETFGLVYVESLSQGLPIIFSKDEGIDGVFSSNIGESCNPIDTMDISQCIERVLKNYNIYNLNEIDFSIFRWEHIANKYLKIYSCST